MYERYDIIKNFYVVNSTIDKDIVKDTYRYLNNPTQSTFDVTNVPQISLRSKSICLYIKEPLAIFAKRKLQ